MREKRDYLAVITIVLLIITSATGMLSLNFDHSYEFVNQYGHSVQMYGYGVYANDTFFQASVSVGTDMAIFFLLVPLFIYTYVKYVKNENQITRLHLISMYAVALYCGASSAFGLTYNSLFLVYVLLFSCSLFGMMRQISIIRLKCTVISSKGLKIFFILSGIALIVAWLPDVIPSLIHDTTLSTIGVYTTAITYVIDMGVIAPLCFTCLILLEKKNVLGVVVEAAMLELCVFVGIVMIPQTACLILAGCDMPIPALITKGLSFILLGGFAFYFKRKLYSDIESNPVAA